MSKRKKQKALFDYFEKKSEIDENVSLNLEMQVDDVDKCNTSTEGTDEASNVSTSFIDNMDIGNFVNNACTSNEFKYNGLQNTWIPPETFEFPILIQSGVKRHFQRTWLNEFPWLAYSAKDAGAYCKMCVLSGKIEGGRSNLPLGSFVSSPFQNYKKGKEMLRAHASNQYHKAAVIKCTNFQESFLDPTKSINVKLNSDLKRRIEENREKLIPIIKTVILCGKQNIPLRGHRDDGNLDETDGSNDGNFRALLRFRIDAGDSKLENHVKTSPKNASFISKTSQNELINACEEVITQNLLEPLKNEHFFSILADETTDSSTLEQVSLSIRFLDIEQKIVKELFLCFIETTDVTGEGLTNLLLNKIKCLGLDVNKIRGQSYDGGPNMSGKYRGVQARIKGIQPLAIFMHCASHKLNLSLSKACTIRNIRNAIDTVGDIVNEIRESSKRSHLLQEKIRVLYPNESKIKIQKLCETRWVERHVTILHFLQIFEAIVSFLDEIDSSKGTLLMNAILKFDFIITLHIISLVFNLTISLSRNLQYPHIDLKECYTMIEDIVTVLTEYRNSPTKYSEIYQKASKVAAEHDVEIKKPRTAGRQTHRSNVEASNASEYYRLNVFLPFLDFIISELAARFSQNEHGNIISLYNLIPTYFTDKVEADSIIEAAKPYEADLPGTINELRAELDLWRQRWKDKAESDCPSTAIDSFFSASNSFYPNIKVLFHILAIIPVTTCTNERSFSTLRRLKTYLRANMKQDRLNGLALLNIHNDMTLNPEDVLNKFAQKHSRKMQLSYF